MVSYRLPTQRTISLELVYSCWLDAPTGSVSQLIPSTFLMNPPKTLVAWFLQIVWTLFQNVYWILSALVCFVLVFNCNQLFVFVCSLNSNTFWTTLRPKLMTSTVSFVFIAIAHRSQIAWFEINNKIELYAIVATAIMRNDIAHAKRQQLLCRRRWDKTDFSMSFRFDWFRFSLRFFSLFCYTLARFFLCVAVQFLF